MVLPRIILLKRTDSRAIPPTRGYANDAGWDVYCIKDQIVWPFCTVDIETGWCVSGPETHWIRITGRSSSWKRRGLFVIDGVVDHGYTGPLSVLVWNPTLIPKRIRAGERLAQILIVPTPASVIKEVNIMPETERGANGFGSSGRH